MKDLISIIIPVYNVQKYLNKCIDSLLAQTYDNLELVLVDDGSTDDSGKIADEYAKRDKRIKVIHKNNGGVSSARNSALEVAKGRYIYFCDSDDYVDANILEQMHLAMEKFNVDLVVCCHDNVYKDTTEYHTNFQSSFVFSFDDQDTICQMFADTGSNMYSSCNKLYKREYVGKFNNNIVVGEDQIFNYQYYSHVGKGYFICQPMYHYVIHSQSAMRRHMNKVFEFKSLLFPYQKEFAVSIKNDRLLTTFCTEYIKDIIRNLYFLEHNHSTKQMKQFFRNARNSDDIKFSLRNIKGLSITDYILTRLVKYRCFYLCRVLARKHYKQSTTKIIK